MGCLNNTHNTAHALGVPHGAKVALMNLSWDSGNTAYVGRGAVPILLQVMNVNSSSPKSVGLLGYLPVIDHGSKGHTNYATATNHVLQKTIGFLLASIEARTQFGFLCNIGSDMFKFYPRIGAMSLDTMERVKYFGLRSVRACGICRLRKGRSVTRKATRHDPVTVAQLYDQANADVRGKDNKRQRKLLGINCVDMGSNMKLNVSFRIIATKVWCTFLTLVLRCSEDWLGMNVCMSTTWGSANTFYNFCWT